MSVNMSIYTQPQPYEVCTVCSYDSKDFSGLINFINEKTTPEEFDQELKKYPNFNFNMGGVCGWNLLTMVSYKGNMELFEHIIKIIVEFGTEELINLGTGFGWTPLFCASLHGDFETGYKIAKKLILLGAKINLATSVGSEHDRGRFIPIEVTPLWAAAYRGNFDLIKLLLRRGAVLNTRNNIEEEGQRILDKAIKQVEQEKKSFQTFVLAKQEIAKNKSSFYELPNHLIEQIYNEYMKFNDEVLNSGYFNFSYFSESLF